MKTAVRYFSKTGNTKSIARAIAGGAKTKAVSITDEPQLKEHVDTLFLGGAPYANIMAPELRRYAEELSADKVGKVVLLRHRTGHAGRSMLLESCSPKRA